MEAKLKLNDYLANAPKNYYCEGKYTDKNGKSLSLIHISEPTRP